MKNKGWVIGLLLLWKTSLCGADTPGEVSGEGPYGKGIETHPPVLRSSQEDREGARRHYELGRAWAIREDFRKAGEEYLKALSLHRMGFTEEERFQMALHLSWGGYLKEAMDLLSEILRANPDHLDARIHLARCLSWAGRFRDALREADSVLQKYPAHREARFIQANVWRWRGEFRRAISLYHELLREKEDFDIRLGLTYALLLRGDRKGAQESASLLRPNYPYQERELAKIREEIRKRTAPFLEGRSQFYSDSDHNRLLRFALSGGGWIDSWEVALHLTETHARDKFRDHQSEEVSFSVYSKPFESLRVGGGMGVTQLRHRESDHYLAGGLNVDVDLFRGTIGARVSRAVLVDTAQLIENRIRVTQGSLQCSQNLGEGISFYGSYTYRDYSDRNHSHDVQLIPRYILLQKDPRFVLGYRFRYLDFERQTRRGYFDPDRFLSHQLLVTLGFEGDRYALLLEPYVGYQSFRRYGTPHHDLIVGGAGNFQYRIGKRFDLLLATEAGNDALGAASGFKYYQFTLGLKAHF
ncbi:MAG: tetratricopeptide repeat protein [Desulfobacterota bacterium]|nr:tetratricopeptide repeat protein [Thermodesulfobacteriota bacterium]